MDTINIILQKLKDKVIFLEGLDYPTFKVERGNFIEVMKTLKDDKELNFSFLASLTAVEYEDKFEAVYHLMNIDRSEIVRIKVDLDKEEPCIESLTDIFKAADLQEREAFDLLGVQYTGHPNLKRVLCPDDFVGHPLRKDFSMRTEGVK
jgi:NADH-quinone oxidoreductase subunit C